MTRLLPGLILAALAWPALAADDTGLYRVELILFENLDPAALLAEQWPADPGTPPVDHAMELSDLTAAAAAAVKPAAAPAPEAAPPPDGSPAPVPGPIPPSAGTEEAQPAPAPVLPAWRWLTPEQLRLNDEEQRLAASGRYRPLLHIGWIQPLDTSEHGTPIHVYDGLQPSQLEAPAAEATGDETALPPPVAGAEGPLPPAAGDAEPTPPPFGPEATPPAEAGDAQGPVEPVAPPHTVDGVFTLWRGRYLHADLDLGYGRAYVPETPAPAPENNAPSAEPQAETVPPQPVAVYVRMTQSRRLRADELHYLDHPLFGALVTVAPYEPPPAEGSAE